VLWLAKRPPPELTKSAIFSALEVNIELIVPDRDQSSGIHSILGAEEDIPVEKNVFNSEVVVINSTAGGVVNCAKNFVFSNVFQFPPHPPAFDEPEIPRIAIFPVFPGNEDWS
jgi:hypothetical protein